MLKRVAFSHNKLFSPTCSRFQFARFCTATKATATTNRRKIPADGPSIKDFLMQGSDSCSISDQEVITVPPYISNHSPGAGRWISVIL